MARVEAELRTRDFYQMIAEPSITEEPVPQVIDFARPRLLSSPDSITTAEEHFTIETSDYEIVPVNLVSSPNYEDPDDWTFNAASQHTITIEQGTDEYWKEGRTLQSAKISLTGSTGSGTTTLASSNVTNVNAPFSAEMWVYLPAATGASVQLRLRAGSASNTVTLRTSDADNWQLVQIEGYNPSSTTAVVSWNAIADATSYNVRYRIQTTGTWVTSTVTTTTTTFTGLTASSTYEFQVRARSATAVSFWSDSVTFDT